MAIISLIAAQAVFLARMAASIPARAPKLPRYGRAEKDVGVDELPGRAGNHGKLRYRALRVHQTAGRIMRRVRHQAVYSERS